jgi:hypothetical protein
MKMNYFLAAIFATTLYSSMSYSMGMRRPSAKEIKKKRIELIKNNVNGINPNLSNLQQLSENIYSLENDEISPEQFKANIKSLYADSLLENEATKISAKVVSDLNHVSDLNNFNKMKSMSFDMPDVVSSGNLFYPITALFADENRANILDYPISLVDKKDVTRQLNLRLYLKKEMNNPEVNPIINGENLPSMKINKLGGHHLYKFSKNESNDDVVDVCSYFPGINVVGDDTSTDYVYLYKKGWYDKTGKISFEPGVFRYDYLKACNQFTIKNINNSRTISMKIIQQPVFINTYVNGLKFKFNFGFGGMLGVFTGVFEQILSVTVSQKIKSFIEKKFESGFLTSEDLNKEYQLISDDSSKGKFAVNSTMMLKINNDLLVNVRAKIEKELLSIASDKDKKISLQKKIDLISK